MRTQQRSSGVTLALVGFVAGAYLSESRPVRAQPHDHANDRANDRAGQVEQLRRMVLPPTAWQMDANLSADRARALATYPHFGGLPTLASAEVWVPNNPGVVLVVSRVVATNAAEPGIAAAVQAATQEFEMSVAATLDVRAEAMPPGGRQFVRTDTPTEIRVEVAQVTLGYQARLVIARDAQRLEAVTTECIWADKDPTSETSKAAAACREALASTDATIVLHKRLPITMPAPDPGGSNATPPDAAKHGSGDSISPSTPSMNGGLRTTLSDDGKIVFPPMRLAPPAPPFNWRPWVFGLGTVIVVIALFLNHRHRQRLEALDGRPIRKRRGSGQPPPATDPRTGRTDADTAASGDGAALEAAPAGNSRTET